MQVGRSIDNFVQVFISPQVDAIVKQPSASSLSSYLCLYFYKLSKPQVSEGILDKCSEETWRILVSRDTVKGVACNTTCQNSWVNFAFMAFLAARSPQKPNQCV